MSFIASRLESLLNHKRVSYQVLRHASDYSAQQTAADTKTPGSHFAKCVLLGIDGRLTLAVIPADRMVSKNKVAEAFGAREVELAEEEELKELCPDCAAGAEPPFGNLYGVPTLVDAELCRCGVITFNGGNHQHVVRMGLVDFLGLSQPRVLHITA